MNTDFLIKSKPSVLGLTSKMSLRTITIDTQVSDPEPQVASKHIIFAVDCSGSMYYEIPLMRTQLKNKFSVDFNDGDSISIIAYASNGQCHTVLENFKVSGMESISLAQKAVDKRLKTMGLTGFVDPIEEAIRIANEHGGNILFAFLSDGYENQNSEQAVLDAVDKLAPLVSSAVVVEYGDYANHNLLLKMSEGLGASFVYAGDFQNYELLFNNIINSKVAASTVEIEVGEDETVFSFADGLVTVYPKGEKVNVPTNLETVYAITDTNETSNVVNCNDTEMFIALYVSVLKENVDFVYTLLEQLGDIRMIREYQNAIGKQRRNQYLNMILDCIVNPTQRFVSGRDQQFMPSPNAYCVINLIEDLGNDSKCVLFSSKMKYKRIGKGADIAPEHTNLKFIGEEDRGVPFTSLALNSSRANISVRVKQHGNVNVEGISGNVWGIRNVPTFKYNNYTIIKDGNVHTPILPMKLSQSMFIKLKQEGCVSGGYDPNTIFDVDISKLPVINRAMIDKVSAEEMAKLNYQLFKQKGIAKFLNAKRKEVAPKTMESDIYTKEQITWLKDACGIGYNGFAPRRIKAEGSSDVYYAPELKLKIKGGSSLPSTSKMLTEWNSKGDINKLTIGSRAVFEGKQLLDTMENTLGQLDDATKNPMIVAFIEKQNDLVNSNKRKIESDFAKMVFARLVGKAAFTDLDLNENNVVVFTDDEGRDVTTSFEENEIEVQL